MTFTSQLKSPLTAKSLTAAALNDLVVAIILNRSQTFWSWKKNSTKPCLTLTSPVENNLELLSTPDKGTEVFIFSTKWSRSSFRLHYFGWSLKIHERTELSQRDLLGDHVRLEEHILRHAFLCLTLHGLATACLPKLKCHTNCMNFTHVVFRHFTCYVRTFHISCMCCYFSRFIHVHVIFPHIIHLFPCVIFFIHKFSFSFTFLLHNKCIFM